MMNVDANANASVRTLKPLLPAHSYTIEQLNCRLAKTAMQSMTLSELYKNID